MVDFLGIVYDDDANVDGIAVVDVEKSLLASAQTPLLLKRLQGSTEGI